MNHTPRWPVVLFDFDGTLANTIDGIVASYTYAWDAVTGRRVTRAEILPWIGRTLTDVFTEQAPDRAAELERVYMDHNFAHLDTNVIGYQGIPQLLHDLVDAGVETAVVTAKRRRTAVPAMRVAGLPEQTILACAKDDTDRHKPDPAPLLKGLEVLGAQVAGSVYVGDAVYDLVAAQAAGMDGVGVTWGAGDPAELRAQRSVAVVDTVPELRSLLLG